jgi:hypothetical protein
MKLSHNQLFVLEYGARKGGKFNNLVYPGTLKLPKGHTRALNAHTLKSLEKLDLLVCVSGFPGGIGSRYQLTKEGLKIGRKQARLRGRGLLKN